MSSSSNYNAITNLTETVIDYLVVDTAEINTAIIESLDCNAGTIDTLTSTTASITSANIPTLTNTTLTNTTSNTTNLNTNNIQPNPVSSAVSLYTTGTGLLTLGNTSNTNALTINQNTTIGTGKKITTPSILVSGLTASKIVLTDASDNLVSSAYNETTLPVSTPQQTALDLKSNIANPTFTTGITTPLLTFNGVQTASKLLLTNASKVVISSAYDETTLPVSTPQQTALDLKSNLASPTFTGTVTTPALNISGISASLLTKTDASKNIVSSLYSETTLPVSTPQQTALDLKSNIANPTFTTGITTPLITFNGVQTASKLLLTNASKVIISSAYTDTDFSRLTANNSFSGSNTFNAITQNNLYDFKQGVAGRMYSNYLTGTSASQDLYFGEDLDTGVIVSLRTFNMGVSGSEKLFRCNKFEWVGFNNDSITFYPTHIGNITIGHATASTDVGTLFIQKNTTIATGKKITTPGILVSGLTASKIVLTDASNNLVSSAYDTTTLPVSTPTQTALNLKSNIASPVFTTSIGLTSGDITITSGKLVNNTFQGTSASIDIDLFSLTTGASILIGQAQAIGSIYLGHLTPASDTGGLYIQKNTILAQNKTLTTGTGGSILCPTFNSTSASQSLTIGGTNTIGDITIGGALTSGSINCGLIGMTGQINCNANTYIGTSGNNKGLVCNYFSSFNTSDLMRYSATSTTGLIRLGESQTSGTITLGHQTPASDSGTLIINKTTTLASNKNFTLGSQSKLVGGSNGSVNITSVAYTNVAVITTASVAGFYQVFIYGASATQTYSVCCFLSADNSGAVQTTASRNMTFQVSGANWAITATVAPTSTISMGYNIVRLF